MNGVNVMMVLLCIVPLRHWFVIHVSVFCWTLAWSKQRKVCSAFVCCFCCCSSQNILSVDYSIKIYCTLFVRECDCSAFSAQLLSKGSDTQFLLVRLHNTQENFTKCGNSDWGTWIMPLLLEFRHHVNTFVQHVTGLCLWATHTACQKVSHLLALSSYYHDDLHCRFPQKAS